MVVIAKLFERLKALSGPTFTVYPIIIIIAIPALLILNTVWNLRSFNRDVNFLLRHQAVSLSDTLKPSIREYLSEGKDVSFLLRTITEENQDVLSATILKKEGDEFKILASSDPFAEAEEVSEDALNRFAQALNQPFAGLIYDPKEAKNVWFVATPLTVEGQEPLIISYKLATETVNEILTRTSRDSILILSILVIITFALLANHFIFYKRFLYARELEELDRLKDEFISMASHELRAPVTALVGYLQLLREKIPKELIPTLQEDLITLDTLTGDLHNLINDLLEVSRIEQNRIKITLTTTDVNQAVSEVIRKMKPLADQKGLQINFSPETIPQIITDKDRVGQVLTNLVNNAIKYSLKGAVSISARTKENFIEVTVRDTGIGIPAEEMPKLFGKFHRVKDRQTKEVRGTGLGLWITKQLVEALGGKIYAESIYGTGSSFTFSLPIRIATR